MVDVVPTRAVGRRSLWVSRCFLPARPRLRPTTGVSGDGVALVAPHFGEGVLAMVHMVLLFWLGFAATTGLITNRFSGKLIQLLAIGIGYQAASLIIMAVVLGLWR